MTFEKLQKQDDIKEEGDVIYSSVFTSNVYPFTVDMAYADKSEKGAGFLNLSLIAESGQTLGQQIYFTNREGIVTYPVKENGKITGEKRYLPGFTLCNDIHEIITDGEPLSEMETKPKLVKVWNKEAGAAIPQEKEVLVNLLKKKIFLAVQEQ